MTPPLPRAPTPRRNRTAHRLGPVRAARRRAAPAEPAPKHRARDQLSRVAGTLTCRRNTSKGGAGEPLRDGDAAYLPAGTELRALTGVDPTLRHGAAATALRRREPPST